MFLVGSFSGPGNSFHGGKPMTGIFTYEPKEIFDLFGEPMRIVWSVSYLENGEERWKAEYVRVKK